MAEIPLPCSGDDVYIWWEEYATWFRGTLGKRVNHSGFKFHVAYDDGDRYVENLDDMNWFYARHGSNVNVPEDYFEPGDVAELKRESMEVSFDGPEKNRRRSHENNRKRKPTSPRVSPRSSKRTRRGSHPGETQGISTATLSDLPLPLESLDMKSGSSLLIGGLRSEHPVLEFPRRTAPIAYDTDDASSPYSNSSKYSTINPGASQGGGLSRNRGTLSIGNDDLPTSVVSYPLALRNSVYERKRLACGRGDTKLEHTKRSSIDSASHRVETIGMKGEYGSAYDGHSIRETGKGIKPCHGSPGGNADANRVPFRKRFRKTPGGCVFYELDRYNGESIEGHTFTLWST